MHTLGVGTVVLLCVVSQGALALDRPPTPVRPRELARGDCVLAAKHVGIDYMQALNRAIAKDPIGLAMLFRFRGTYACDGGAEEGHLAILIGLLQRWSNRPFAHVLRSPKPPFAKLSMTRAFIRQATLVFGSGASAWSR